MRNSSTLLVGFTGGMGVGKSTAVAALRQYLKQRSECRSDGLLEVVKFAGPLYEMQEAIYDIIAPAHVRPPYFIKDRKLLQWLGTEWGRDTISKTLWVDLWKAQALNNLTAGISVVCDDCRYDNEAEVIKNLGGVIIKITSNRVEDRGVPTGITGHRSEDGINPKYVNFTVENNSDIDSFKASLHNVYASINTQKERE